MVRISVFDRLLDIRRFLAQKSLYSLLPQLNNEEWRKENIGNLHESIIIPPMSADNLGQKKTVKCSGQLIN